jgi:Tfp pilus assembly protein PilP
MSMISRVGVVFAAILLTSVPVWAQAQAAIGAAKDARSAVERASEGAPPQSPAPPAAGAQAPAPKSAAQAPAPKAAAQAPASKAAAQAPAPKTSAQPPAPGGAKPTPAPPAASAQPAPPEAPPATAAQPPAAEAPIEPPGFTYNPEGRRDPFVSLVRRGATTTRTGVSAAARPGGLAGLETAEVNLRGTVRSREGFVAILQGADQKTYIVRAGDKLLDGTVRTISQNDMVILQQVNDPLSLEKQREVRKVLRQAEAN